MLIYIDKVKNNAAEFEQKVIEICRKLGIDPNWLMAVMWIESEFKTTAVNTASGAVGLIQFTPSTAADLGTTTQELLQLDNIHQLDYVYQYLKPHARKIKSFIDCYFAVFFPAAIGRYSDYILQSYGLSAAYVAGLNPAFDENKDNQLTFREVEQKVLLMVDPAYRQQLVAEKATTATTWDFRRLLVVLLALLLIFSGIVTIYKSLK